jgi:hypothetical protein
MRSRPGASRTRPLATQNWNRVLPNAKFDSKDPWLRGLVDETLSLFPSTERPLPSVVLIRVRERSSTEGRVGLTTFSYVGGETEERQGRLPRRGKQRIDLYGRLFSQLSEEAAIGVIAHELAHAWLNEHVSPESSKRREAEADELARSWGYGKYLDSLDAEAYSF